MITEREIGVAECVAQAKAFLAQSDEEFAFGRYKAGRGEAVWGSVAGGDSRVKAEGLGPSLAPGQQKRDHSAV